MYIPVKVLRYKLQHALDVLDHYEDNDEVKTHSSTYGLSSWFLGLGNYGFTELDDFDVEYADEADESKKAEGLSPKLELKKKYLELDRLMKGLAVFGKVLGIGVKDILDGGEVKFYTGLTDDQDDAERKKDTDAIFADFDDYIDYKVTHDDDGWFVTFKFKPEFWELEAGDAGEVLQLLNDELEVYC